MSGFRARWAELKKEGWTSKRPAGLSVDFTYLRPGKTKKDTRGVDVFVGEEELMRYLDRLDIESAAKAKQVSGQQVEEQCTDQLIPECPVASLNVSPNPPLQTLSDDQNPQLIDKATAADKDSYASEANNTASPAPMLSISPHITLSPLRECSPAVTDRDYQNGGTAGSDEDEHTQRNLNNAFNEVSDAPAVPGPRRSARITDLLLDANIVRNCDDPNEYEAMASDAENDDGVASDGNSDVDVEFATEIDELDEEETEDPLFNESLLDAVGGIANIVNGTIDADILKDMSTNGWSNPVLYNPLPYLNQPYVPRTIASLQEEYPGINGDDYGPTPRALDAASSASGALFYFLQPQLWESIAEASNEYFEEKIDERVDGQYEKQKKRERKSPTFRKSSHAEIKASLLRTPDITARELCVFVGLLIARTISPNKEKLENHWKMTDESAIPRGRFGLFMTRDRFMHISRNLHFSSNNDPRAASDRIWKLRPVVDAVQSRFQAGYMPPPVMVFDEAMLPSQSSFNKTRVYMKDKPHKWGTKLFMLCCSSTAYCMRFEVYCGKRQTIGISTSNDTKSGPTAVIRNLSAVFGPSGTSKKRLIVTDRFYTSPALSLQLLAMGFYSVGTVMTNRRGLCKEIIVKKKTRPVDVLRGTYTVAESKLVPSVKMVCWWDNRPVHLLCAGGSVEHDRVLRRDKTGEKAEVACPKILKDYQTFMGGVDVHDQLRLQRYSLQLALKYKKYYKSLFLGFVDLAIVNAFIVFNRRRTNEGKLKLKHVKFMKQLHTELVQLQESDWTTLCSMEGTPVKTPTSTRQRAHVPLQVDEWREGNNGQGRKRRQRACKVCSMLKGSDEAKGGETTFYCSSCKLPSSKKQPTAARVYLCNKVKHAINGEAVSCFEIWHKCWRNGTLLPPSKKKKRIRARKPGTRNARTTVTASANSSEEEGEDVDDSARQPKRRHRVDTTE